MGVGLRVVTERVRQATGLKGKNFQPTSNVRNESMYKEASEFASHLKKCLSAIEQMKNANDTMLRTTREAMSAPLPHVYEETAVGGGGEGVRPIEKIGGPTFLSDVVMKLSQQASATIEGQVLTPIKRWLECFNSLGPLMKELEALRLEVDSRRHTVIGLAADVDKMRTKLSKASGSDGKIENALDATLKKLQHKESKLGMVVQSYQEKKELSLYNDLTTLITDAKWLRHYMALALRCQGEALSGAAHALGDGDSAAAAAAAAGPASLDVSSLSISSGGGTGGVPSAPLVPTPQAGSMTPPSASASPVGTGATAVEPYQSHAQPFAPPQPYGNSNQAAGAPNPFMESGVLRH